MRDKLRAIVVVCCALVAASAVALADQSTTGTGTTVDPLLLRLLKGIQELPAADTLSLHVWSTYSKPDLPSPNLTPLDQIETDILLKLTPVERSAMLTWLDMGGRSKLYALGVTDNDIGPCIDMIDASNCRITSAGGGGSGGGTAVTSAASGPVAARDLPLTLAPGSDQNGGVMIEHGFATVKTNATSETHCLTFKNAGAKKIDGITFVYKLFSQNGQVLTAGSNLRTGSFEPGAEVPGPATAADLAGIRSDGPDKALLANCWTKTTQLATPELLRASYISVGVVSVTYDDGTHWALGQ